MHKINPAQEDTLLIKLAYTNEVLTHRPRKLNKLRKTCKFSLKIINQTDTQELDLHDLFGLTTNLMQFLKIIFMQCVYSKYIMPSSKRKSIFNFFLLAALVVR